jgi:glutamine synthetase
MNQKRPDPSSNPYLTSSAMLMAAVDGIRSKIDPGQPPDKDIYDLPPAEAAKVPQTQGSPREVLKALQSDHQHLLKTDVFTPDVIETWIDHKISRVRGTGGPYDLTAQRAGSRLTS